MPGEIIGKVFDLLQNIYYSGERRVQEVWRSVKVKHI